MAAHSPWPPGKTHKRINPIHVGLLSIALVTAAPFWYASQMLQYTTNVSFQGEGTVLGSALLSKYTPLSEMQSEEYKILFEQKYMQFARLTPLNNPIVQEAFSKVKTVEYFHNDGYYKDNCQQAFPAGTAGYLTVQQHKIQCEWKDFRNRMDMRRQVPYVVIGSDVKKPWENNTKDITLVMMGSSDRLHKLLTQLQQWKGPVSVALYVTKEKHIDQAFDFIRRNFDTVLHQVSFHFFLEKLQGTFNQKLFPHNHLRNCAMNFTDTDHMIYVDMDFVVGGGSNPYRSMTNLLNTEPSIAEELQNQTLLVLPAFEMLEASYKDEIHKTFVPKSKKELTRMVLNEASVQPFHWDRVKQGHQATNFDVWYQNSSGVSYPIAFERGFEPYVLGKKEDFHFYWPRFRGFGFNKASWLQEAHNRGFRYAVLRDFYVFHVGLEGRKKAAGNSSFTKEEFFFFHDYLDANFRKKSPK